MSDLEQEVQDMMDKLQNEEISQEEFNAFLDGKSSTELTEETDGDTVDKTEGASPDSEKEEVKETEQKTAESDEDEEEPVILTKDGRHTIPYSALVDVREDAREKAARIDELSAKLTEQSAIIEQLQAAQKKDEAAGNTDATDELISDLAEDYPGAVKMIADLQSKLNALLEKDQQHEAATAADTAQQEYEAAITKLNPDFAKVKGDENFWSWFGSQPSYIKAAQSSGDPQQVADVVKLYTDSQTKPAPASDKAATVDVKKVEEAIKKAESKSTVNSLSDIPGGSNPETDEMSAIANMDALAMSQKFMDMDPATLEAKLSRML